MGQVVTRIARPFRNYNVDNRAAKVLEKRQTVAEPAPYYPTTVEKLTRFRDEHPEFLEAQQKRDEKLHEHLKKVYVESTGDSVQVKTSTKPYPLNRKPPPDTDMGALEQTSDIPDGYASLKTVVAFIGQHQSDPKNFTAEKIAKEHKLDQQDVEHVLQYFKLLHLHIPKEMYEQNKKMSKIVAEQIKASASKASTFLLSDKDKTDKTGKPQSDSNLPKLNE